MFEKILVPTDFSKYSQKVLECVSEIPGVKEVVLLHVIGPADPLARVWDPGAKAQEASKKLETQAAFLKGLGLTVKERAEVILEGDVARVIENVATEEKAPLVVMGARGKSLIEGIFLGNVSKGVLRIGKTDLLIMRYKMLDTKEGKVFEKYCARIFTKILATTDFSEASKSAINFVKDLKGVEEVTLVNVVSSGETEEIINANITEATKKLNAIASELTSAGHKVKISVSTGNPSEEIIKAARAMDASLIAMSSHGTGWFKELMIGSTAYEVARMAERPVLIIRSKIE